MKSTWVIPILVIIIFSSTFTVPSYHNSSSQAFAQTSDEIRDIGKYVLLGFDETIVEQNVSINSGNVGVHNENSQVTIKEGTTFLDSNSALAGDFVKIEINANAQNVFFNDLILEGTILGSQSTPLTLPLVDGFPEIPDLQAGTSSVNVPKGQTQTLPPGSYDTIFVDEGATLIFVGGTYNADSITTGVNAKLFFDDASEIITQQLKVGNNSIIGPSSSASISASDIVLFVHDNAEPTTLYETEIGKNSVVDTNVFSPSGKLLIKQGTQATGSFVAKTVKIEKDSTLTLNSAIGIITTVNRIQDTFTDLEAKNEVFDESIVVDVIEKEVLDLKDKVIQQIADQTIQQNLIEILDSARTQLQDAENAVLDADEIQANTSLGEIQTTLNNFITSVEVERGAEISGTLADELVSDAEKIIADSQFRDVEVIGLLQNNSTLSLMDTILQQQSADIDTIRLLVAQLEADGVIVEAEVFEESPKKVKIKVNFPPGVAKLVKEIIEEIPGSVCGTALTLAVIDVIINQAGAVLEQGEITILYFVSKEACEELPSFAFNSLFDTYLQDQTVIFLQAVGEFLIRQGTSFDLVNALNQPDVRDFWENESGNAIIEFLAGLFFGVNLGIPETLDKIIGFIAGTITGTVYEDLDNSRDFTEGLESGIDDATIEIEDVRRPGIIVKQTLSAPNGFYLLPNLATATYLVSQQPIDGFLQVAPNLNDPFEGKYQVDIVSTVDVAGRDFGNVRVEPSSHTFDVVYTADTLPEFAGFSEFIPDGHNGCIQREILSGGIYHFISSISELCLESADVWNANPATGFTAEARVKVNSFTGDQNLGGIAIWVASPDSQANLILREGSIKEFETKQTLAMDTTSDFHTYRITVKDNTWKIFVDNVLKLTGTTNGFNTNELLFGDGSLAASGDAEWDCVAYTTSGAFSPSELAPVCTGPPPPPIPTTGLIAEWLFDELSGLTALDTSGNNNDGILINGPIRLPSTSCQVGNCLSFDGVDDHVNAGNNPILNNLSDKVSVSMWLKSSGAPFLDTGILVKGFSLAAHAGTGGSVDHKVYFVIKTDTFSFLPSATLFNDNQWHHFAGTYDGSTMKIYVDGVLEDSLAKTGNIQNLGDTDLLIGIRADGINGYSGSIDQVRMYNGMLSQSEILALFNEG